MAQQWSKQVGSEVRVTVRRVGAGDLFRVSVERLVCGEWSHQIVGRRVRGEREAFERACDYVVSQIGRPSAAWIAIAEGRRDVRSLEAA